MLVSLTLCIETLTLAYCMLLKLNKEVCGKLQQQVSVGLHTYCNCKSCYNIMYLLCGTQFENVLWLAEANGVRPECVCVCLYVLHNVVFVWSWKAISHFLIAMWETCKILGHQKLIYGGKYNPLLLLALTYPSMHCEKGRAGVHFVTTTSYIR